METVLNDAEASRIQWDNHHWYLGLVCTWHVNRTWLPFSADWSSFKPVIFRFVWNLWSPYVFKMEKNSYDLSKINTYKGINEVSNTNGIRRVRQKRHYFSFRVFSQLIPVGILLKFISILLEQGLYRSFVLPGALFELLFDGYSSPVLASMLFSTALGAAASLGSRLPQNQHLCA